MGKFYKILKIICLIIFILSFFTRVFALSDPVPVTINGVDYSVDFAYIVDDYSYYAVIYDVRRISGYDYFSFWVYCSNGEFNINRGNNGFEVKRTGSSTVDQFSIGLSRLDKHSISDAFSRWNNITFDVSNGANYSYFSDGYLTISQRLNLQNVGSVTDASFTLSNHILYSNFDIKNTSGDVVFESNVNVDPYIVNSAQIPDWSFDELEINLGEEQFDLLTDKLRVTYNDNTTLIHIYTKLLDHTAQDYNGIVLSKQNLSSYIHFIEDSDITFTYVRYNSQTHQDEDLYDLGTYHVLLTTSVVNDLNNNSEQNFKNDMYNGLSDIDSSIQQGNMQNHEDMQELKDTMTDSTVESTASDLPSTDVSDISAEGINTIFQSIYNAFCTGNASNIVFPIPFTGKNITLSPYYVRDMLTNNGATWVYTLIQAFWGYLIGRYIVKDVSKKITKIKGGNIENIENDNIKEEML